MRTWLVVIAGMVAACEPPAREVTDLESARAVDLGGGDSPRAWQVVFVGDGFHAEDLPAYRAHVDELVAGLTSNATGFVAMEPAAFHFHRVDASGEGWYLGTQLDQTESCGAPMIVADRERVGLSARRAVPTPDVIVVLANDVDGRANFSGDVHLSTRDSWNVLEHELSHALFHLGDEYQEYQWCSERTLHDEAELLATSNLTLPPDPAKWADIDDGVAAGGGRWPCMHHPTKACTMLAAETGAFCPVCAASIRETISARLCGDDDRAPRVALNQPPGFVAVDRSGATLHLEVAAFDESDVQAYRLVLDGRPIAESTLPWIELASDELAPGAHVLVAEAIDAGGHVGSSAAAPLDVQRTVELAPSVAALEAAVGDDDWVHVTVTATPPGGTLSLAHGASTVTSEIPWTQPMSVWLPVDPEGATLSATATTARGLASPPVVAALGAPAAIVAEPPVIELVRVNGSDLASLAALGPEVELEVGITSCAPLRRLEVTDRDGKLLGERALTPEQGCLHLARIVVAPTQGVLTVAAIDQRGRRGTRDVIAPPIIDPVTCGSSPTVDDRVVALARPAMLAFGAPGTLANASVTVGGERAALFRITRPDGRPGALLAARDVPGGPYDGDDVELRVTTVATCPEGLLGSTAGVAVAVDAVAPRLRVSRFTRGAAPRLIEASDGGGDVTIEELVAGDARVVRVRDPAGNTSEQTIIPVVFPDDRAGCPR